MFCTSCGVKLLEQTKFCSNCGTTLKLPNANSDDMPTTARPRSNVNVDTAAYRSSSVQQRSLSRNEISVAEQLHHANTTNSNKSRRVTISTASLISGLILIGYVIGYLLPWFKGITGLDVVRGLSKASSILGDASSMLGLGNILAGPIADLYYMMVATLIASVAAGVFALAKRSKVSIVFVLLVSLFDLYFLSSLYKDISNLANFIPGISSSWDIAGGSGIYVIILAVLLSAIISFIALFLPNPKSTHGISR